ncbi:MAG: hypothetical protein HC890_14390 [Chloroflexaceae bacterium]|nr:hypothetical protein [Chloroflexaceae bacterium]
MPFSVYKTLGAVATEFQIEYTVAEFVRELSFAVPLGFQEELDLLLSDGVVDNSEAAICEALIYPILKEVWKFYRHQFTLWSHQTLSYSEQLFGQPNYILAKRSPLGTVVFDQPYFLVVEAKQDKFEEGWGQCLAELIAVQGLNNQSIQTLFGMVSNGKIWQFGRLENQKFTRNKRFYSIQELTSLFGAVNFVFNECQQQLQL